MLQPPAAQKKSRQRFDRQAMLEIAMKLFWQHGYEATSMAALLEATGLTAPSLYAAFGNKQGLFLEAVRHYLDLYAPRIFSFLEENISARDAIARVLHATAETCAATDHPTGCLITFGAVTCAPSDNEVEVFLRQLRHESEGLIQKRLVRAVKEGELPRGFNPARLAKFFATVLGGIHLQSRDGATATELHAVADDAISVWPATTRSPRVVFPPRKGASRARKTSAG